jgi:hypothetical protein
VLGPAVAADVVATLHIGEAHAHTAATNTGKSIDQLSNDAFQWEPLQCTAASSATIDAMLSGMHGTVERARRAARTVDGCAKYTRYLQAFVDSGCANSSSSFVGSQHASCINQLMAAFSAVGPSQPVVFSGNPAGAVSVYVNTSVQFHGTTLFVHNAGEQGAAIQASSNAKVYAGKDSTTMFASNHATRSGGAAHCMGSNNCIFEGTTFFIDNKSSLGGALAASGSSKITMHGNTLLFNNTAAGAGVVHVTDDRTVAFDGQHTAFVSNAAYEASGGCILVDSSAQLQLSGQTLLLVNNSAHDGAALHALDSAHVSMGANFTFCAGNAVIGSGACTLLSGHSKLASNTSGCFLENAAASGGAVSLIDESVCYEAGRWLLANNVADGPGGGVSMSDKAQLVLQPGSVLHLALNAAQAEGGIAATGNSSILMFANATLSTVNNTAQSNGGGLFISTSTMGMVSLNDKAGVNSTNVLNTRSSDAAARALAAAASGNHAPLNADLALAPTAWCRCPRQQLPAFSAGSGWRMACCRLPWRCRVQGAGRCRACCSAQVTRVAGP